MSQGTELVDAPSDGISNVCFSSQNDSLLVSSWDGSVRLYDTANNSLRNSYNHTGGVLDCCFMDAATAVSGGISKEVNRYDFHGGGMDTIGTHDLPVKCVEYSDLTGLVVSGSWDKTVRAWDPRAAPADRCAAVLPQPGKVFSMSLVQDKLVVATGGRRVQIYDVRNLGTPLQERESSLKFQTRCVRVYPDAQGYAMSSVEGRVAMEYFDRDEAAQAKKYAFKCHRKNEGGRDTVYPVNAIAFHPVHGTFATGGCDGIVNVWDGNNKKRLYQFARYPTSIASLAFSRDGGMLAVASSYTFEEGEKDHDLERIYVRQINDAEVKPKPKAAA